MRKYPIAAAQHGRAKRDAWQCGLLLIVAAARRSDCSRIEQPEHV
jgi:hypothetical protein